MIPRLKYVVCYIVMVYIIGETVIWLYDGIIGIFDKFLHFLVGIDEPIGDDDHFMDRRWCNIVVTPDNLSYLLHNTW